MKRAWFVFCLVLLYVGCSPKPTVTPDGSGGDGGNVDRSVADTSPTDNGTADTGPTDNGPADTGATDNGPVDNGPTDSGPVDNGPVDNGPADNGPADTQMDSGPQDTQTPDADDEPATDQMMDAGSEMMADAGSEMAPEPMADVAVETMPETTMEVGPEPLPELPTDITGLTCQERVSRSNTYVEAVRSQYLSCSGNTECTSVFTSTECRGACGKAVNTTGKPKVEDAIKQVNQSYCKNYRQDNCPYATPRCVNARALCDENTCVLLQCSERSSKARAYVQNVLQNNLTCSADSDCTTVSTGTNCAGACPVAVNKTGAPLVQAAVQTMNQTICDNYQQDMCPYATPSCVAGTLKCDAGQCKLIFSP